MGEYRIKYLERFLIKNVLRPVRMSPCLLLVLPLLLGAFEMAQTGQAVSMPERITDDPAITAPRATKTPVQMVRALQHMHDAVVRGDKQAPTRQARLLGDIGRHFSHADPSLFADRDNLYALVTYLFNGGNPNYVAPIVESAPPDLIESFLLEGALAYARGNEQKLIASLGGVDLDQMGWGVWPQDLRLSAYLALAPYLTLVDPKAAQERLDFVRILAPGSLFEEAALRRQVKLTALLKDEQAMRRVIISYARRFAASPYAVDFWHEVRLALPLFEVQFDDDTLASLMAMMPQRVQYIIYLRMSRQALLDGRMTRAALMATRALDVAKTLDVQVNDSPARLYLAATMAASERAGESVAALQAISQENLPERDRLLLEVVRNIAQTVALKENQQTANIDAVLNEAIAALKQTDEGAPHGEIIGFLTKAQEKLNQIDQLLEQ